MNLAQMIPIGKLGTILPYAFPWLQKAAESSPVGYTLHEIVDGLKTGAFQLWADCEANKYRGFVVTEIRSVDDLIQVHLVLGGGFGLEYWENGIAAIELWAKELGAKEVKIWGRPGWQKIMKKHGYELETQILSRNIETRVQ